MVGKTNNLEVKMRFPFYDRDSKELIRLKKEKSKHNILEFIYPLNLGYLFLKYKNSKKKFEKSKKDLVSKLLEFRDELKKELNSDEVLHLSSINEFYSSLLKDPRSGTLDIDMPCEVDFSLEGIKNSKLNKKSLELSESYRTYGLMEYKLDSELPNKRIFAIAIVATTFAVGIPPILIDEIDYVAFKTIKLENKNEGYSCKFNPKIENNNDNKSNLNLFNHFFPVIVAGIPGSIYSAVSTNEIYTASVQNISCNRINPQKGISENFVLRKGFKPPVRYEEGNFRNVKGNLIREAETKVRKFLKQ